MPRFYPSSPAVSAALSDTRAWTFRGNTFGQFDSYISFSNEERAVAAGFDSKKERDKAIEARKRAGLSVPELAGK